MYNHIRKKKCKCGTEENPCNLYPTLGYAGYARVHAPEDVIEKVGTRTQLANRKKRGRLTAARKIKKDAYSEDKVKLSLWHLARRYECTGVCRCGCGQKSSRNNDKRYKWSNAHILPKSRFDSVIFHPLNHIELNEDCHWNFDHNGSDKWPFLACWPEIVRKFKVLYPLTLLEEHQFIPQVLLDSLCEKNQEEQSGLMQ